MKHTYIDINWCSVWFPRFWQELILLAISFIWSSTCRRRLQKSKKSKDVTDATMLVSTCILGYEYWFWLPRGKEVDQTSKKQDQWRELLVGRRSKDDGHRLVSEHHIIITMEIFMICWQELEYKFATLLAIWSVFDRHNSGVVHDLWLELEYKLVAVLAIWTVWSMTTLCFCLTCLCVWC
jgi:hypothetical protein